MNDSFGTSGGFNSSTAVGGGGTGDADGKSQGMLPVVVRQIQNCSEDGLTAFGVCYKMMTLVAIVRNIEHSSTKITYTLEDYSGRLDALLWLEEGDSGEMKSPLIPLDSYVRIVGSVRTSGGTKNVMIFKIDPIRTINEVSTHYLEVLMARYKGEELGKHTSIKSSMMDTGVTMSQVEDIIGLKGKELAIYQAIEAHGGEIGMNRKELLAKFPAISASDLATLTDHMTQEGHIYTSIDLDHFMCVG